MISHAIEACLGSVHVDDVVVTTDDEEIALIARRFGANVLIRPSHLSDDITTLDPVIVFSVEQAEKKYGTKYDFVVTVQPTSPLVLPIDIDKSVQKIISTNAETIISVIDDRHLTWGIVEGRPSPNYKARVNRQQLPKTYRETGAVVVCSRAQLSLGSRVGANIDLYVMPKERSIDVDTIHDIHMCEAMLSSKRIVFVVAGYREIGLGHVYRALLLAHEFVKYSVIFVCEAKDDLAISQIKQYNYDIEVCSEGSLSGTVLALRPDLIINDILDTTENYVRRLKADGAAVVNFEDMGSGSSHADFTINALYPHQLKSNTTLSGPDYFCLRDEFLHIKRRPFSNTVTNILLTFGGVDEGNITCRVLSILSDLINDLNIKITVVVGPGYLHDALLNDFYTAYNKGVLNIIKNTNQISEYMNESDFAITSGGRTVYELASLYVPSVVLCQNKREVSHTYASEKNGVVNLGLHSNVSDEEIAETLRHLINDSDYRLKLHTVMSCNKLSEGKQRVVSLLVGLIDRC